MSKTKGEFTTDLENIDGVEVVYEADEDGNVDIISVDKKRENHGWTDLMGVLNASTMASIKERCEEHIPEARAEEDEYLQEQARDRELKRLI